MPYLPLSGIRVLDLSRLLPGPYLTQLLADLGAEVIKIETPTAGDYTRFAPPEMGLGNMLDAINRGKKSVGVNYRNPAGRAVFLKLAASADVILEGFKPGSVKRWGIDYESIKAVKADIVYCSLSGYGQQGPFSDRAGHDLNYLAIAGALSLNARRGEAPVPYGLPVADLSGGMLAAIAILGALVGHRKTGEGAYLDMAIFDGVLSWMAPLAGAAYFAGLGIAAGTHPLLGGQPCYNLYETADGKYLTLGAIEPTFWSDFCKVTGRNDLLSHQFDRSMLAEVAAVFKQKTRDEWLRLFDGTSSCVEPVNSFEEMLEHPQVKSRGYIHRENDQPVGMNSPFVFAHNDHHRAPVLGEHTRSVLTELGLTSSELEDLSQRKIIALP